MMGRKGNVKTVEQEERVKKYNSKALRQREMKAKKEGKRNVKKQNIKLKIKKTKNNE